MRRDQQEATARYLPPRDRTQMADERRAALGLAPTVLDENALDCFYMGALWTDRGLAFVGPAGTLPPVYPLQIENSWFVGRNFVDANWAEGLTHTPDWPTALADWSYRFPIATVVPPSGGCVRFPLYLRGDEMPSDLWTLAQADGDDLVFSDADGNIYPHALTHFAPGSTAMECHVLLPRLHGTYGNRLWCYLGNADCDAQQDAAATFTDYIARWGYGESGATLADSTSTGLTLDRRGDMVQGTGKLYSTGGQLHPDGDGDGGRGDVAALATAMNEKTSLAFSCWLKRGDTGREQKLLESLTTSGNYKLAVWLTAADQVRCLTRPVGTDTTRSVITTDTIADTASWHHLVVVVDTVADTVNFYLDGSLMAGSGAAGALGTYDAINFGTYFGVGIKYTGGSGANAFMGLLDEVRLLASAPSVSRIAAEYANQGSPSTFYSCGAIEEQ